MMKRQKGFFLIDWISAFFDASILTIVFRLIVMTLAVYLGFLVVPAYREAYQVHQVLKDYSTQSQYSNSRSELSTKIQSELLHRRINLPEGSVGIDGPIGSMTVSAAWDKKIKLWEDVFVVIAFSMDQEAELIEVLTGPRQ